MVFIALQSFISPSLCGRVPAWCIWREFRGKQRCSRIYKGSAWQPSGIMKVETMIVNCFLVYNLVFCHIYSCARVAANSQSRQILCWLCYVVVPGASPDGFGQLLLFLTWFDLKRARQARWLPTTCQLCMLSLSLAWWHGWWESLQIASTVPLIASQGPTLRFQAGAPKRSLHRN